MDNTTSIGVILLIITGPPVLESSYSFNVSEGATNGTVIGFITFTDEGKWKINTTEVLLRHFTIRDLYVLHTSYNCITF